MRAFYATWNVIKEELLIVLGTSSSEAALPALMEKLEQMGCSKSVVGLVIPAGYSFNFNKTIYLSMATIFLAQVYGVDLSFAQVMTIIGVLMVTSKGAAGVTGSGFVVLASTLWAVRVIPIEGLALLLGVDRFMSEARAIRILLETGWRRFCWPTTKANSTARNEIGCLRRRCMSTKNFSVWCVVFCVWVLRPKVLLLPQAKCHS